MHTLGHDFVPPGIHAGGLRYHGAAPIVSQLVLDGLIRAEAYPQNEVFEAAVQFARSEGDHPGARELRTPSRARSTPPAGPTRRATQQTILFNLSGHGHFDMAAYDAYLARQARGLRAAGGRDRARAARDRVAAQAGGGDRLAHADHDCPACGGAIPDGARFCPTCGRPVSAGRRRGAEAGDDRLRRPRRLDPARDQDGRRGAAGAAAATSTTSCRRWWRRSAARSRSSSATRSWPCSACPRRTRTTPSGPSGPRSACGRG